MHPAIYHCNPLVFMHFMKSTQGFSSCKTLTRLAKYGREVLPKFHRHTYFAKSFGAVENQEQKDCDFPVPFQCLVQRSYGLFERLSTTPSIKPASLLRIVHCCVQCGVVQRRRPGPWRAQPRRYPPKSSTHCTYEPTSG